MTLVQTATSNTNYITLGQKPIQGNTLVMVIETYNSWDYGPIDTRLIGIGNIGQVSVSWTKLTENLYSYHWYEPNPQLVFWNWGKVEVWIGTVGVNTSQYISIIMSGNPYSPHMHTPDKFLLTVYEYSGLPPSPSLTNMPEANTQYQSYAASVQTIINVKEPKF
jgi:hypothetical protein